MKRSEFRHLDRLRVRWAEVDMQRIVFNGHYLMYFDTAVAGYWRSLALPYHDTMEALQGDLYVRKATLEYHASARYDDLIDVGIRCGRIGNSSMAFTAAVLRGEQVLVSGELVYVFADPATQTSRPVPPALRDVLNGFEAGQPMLELRVLPWQQAAGDAARLRHAAFVRELGLPEELAGDLADHDALHALAVNRLGATVGTARLTTTTDGSAQVGRLAVSDALRGAGVGQMLVAGLLAAARERHQRHVVCDALADTVGFWRRAGFVAEGEPFESAGHSHQRMVATL